MRKLSLSTFSMVLLFNKNIRKDLIYLAILMLTSGAVFGNSYFTSYFHLRYSAIHNAENYFSIRRFILFGKLDSLKNTTLSWRFIYQHNSKMSTDDHITPIYCVKVYAS